VWLMPWPLRWESLSAQGDLLPEEKVAAIEQLRREENKLAMIGDGVNDAPAMARSTVGIAMGAAAAMLRSKPPISH